MEAAYTGRDALDLATKFSFDIIFMDIELPDIDGYEATKLIRELEDESKRVPIVALTAHDIVEEKSKLLLAGMDDVLEKPLTTKHISIILDRWVIGTQSNTVDLTRIEQTKNTEEKPQTEQPESSPVNLSESLSLAKNDKSLAKDMLTMLLNNLAKERNKVNNCALEADLQTMYETIHKLYGACCYCGVPRLRAITKIIDRSLKNRDETDLIENLKEFYEASDELILWHEHHDIAALFE
jgi:two-component system sensor histidine kinase BarA